MADLDIKRFTTIEHTIRTQLTREQVERIVAEYVREESSFRLKDFAMRCDIEMEAADDGEPATWSCVVTGTSKKQKGPEIDMPTLYVDRPKQKEE